MPTWFTTADLAALAPLIVLAAGAFAVLLADAAVRGTRGSLALPYISVGTIGLAALAAAAAWSEPRVAAGGSLALGPLAAYVSLLVLAAAALASLFSIDDARRLGFDVGEYYGLLLFSTAGMLYLVAANDFVSLFIAFELMSLSIYALVGVSRQDRRSAEGAMKYFVLGSFSSAFLLFGLALLYGATGSIYLHEVRAALGNGAPLGITLAALALLIVGFAFKVGAVPFHAWVPDAYEGAPAAVTGFMAVAVKAAAFAVLVRLLHATGLLAGTQTAGLASSVLQALAIATLVLANFAALAQQNLQRMLAYSSIAHSGYVLVGLVAATQAERAAAAALFYLAAYGAMTIGAFAVLTVLRRDGRQVEEFDDLAGLAWERPGPAAAMMIFMASLIGVPPTAGFLGKLWVFRSAVEAGFTSLVVLAVLTTAVSIYYYLRVVVVMFMGEAATATATSGEALAQPRAAAPASFGGTFAVGAAVAATLLLGLLPGAAIHGATRSIEALIGR